jgi:hypothetical protein
MWTIRSSNGQWCGCKYSKPLDFENTKHKLIIGNTTCLDQDVHRIPLFFVKSEVHSNS